MKKPDHSLRQQAFKWIAEAQPVQQKELVSNARQYGYTDERMNAAVRFGLNRNKLPLVEQQGYAVALTEAALEKIKKQYPYFPALAAAITVFADRGEGKASAYVIGYTAEGKPAVASILNRGRGRHLEDTADHVSAKQRIADMQALLESVGAKVGLATGRTYTPAGTRNTLKTGL